MLEWPTLICKYIAYLGWFNLHDNNLLLSEHSISSDSNLFMSNNMFCVVSSKYRSGATIYQTFGFSFHSIFLVMLLCLMGWPFCYRLGLNGSMILMLTVICNFSWHNYNVTRFRPHPNAHYIENDEVLYLWWKFNGEIICMTKHFIGLRNNKLG